MGTGSQDHNHMLCPLFSASMYSHSITVSVGPTWQGSRHGPNGLQVGTQQEAEAFCIHILPTGSVHGGATGLRAEAV